MKGYIAEFEGTAIFLTKDEQMDMALKNGCIIMRVEDNDDKTIVATPECGYLKERPTLEDIETMTNPYVEILTSLEKGE